MVLASNFSLGLRQTESIAVRARQCTARAPIVGWVPVSGEDGRAIVAGRDPLT
ncbi:hypothetical protein [Mycobacterium sp. Aquia_213]|uniref:hypothetical protein n=1 Tax=Mycobacterium sp. Aquia_213 TaxID=2991728 RepID=UPI00226E166D|nr:hypothetical protein [Mycobacterium sp. Aquia_213]WAC90269.1 hypothetical protein LMQ14_20400 [Mycobacterium sp. Aquia_213]